MSKPIYNQDQRLKKKKKSKFHLRLITYFNILLVIHQKLINLHLVNYSFLNVNADNDFTLLYC